MSYTHARMLGPLTVLIIAVWGLYQSEPFRNNVPQLWKPSKQQTTYEELKHPAPSNTQQAFKLGELHQEYVKNPNVDQEEKLRAAEGVLEYDQEGSQPPAENNQDHQKKQKKLTQEQFNEMYDEILKIESHKSTYQKFRAMLKIANFVWLISIVGITCTCGTVVSQFCSSIIAPLCAGIFAMCCCIGEAFIKAMRILHSLALDEQAMWVFSFVQIAQGLREEGEYAKFMIPLTGWALAIPANMMALANANPPKTGKGAEFQFSTYCLQLGLLMIPLAIMQKSEYLGWITVISFHLWLDLGLGTILFFPIPLFLEPRFWGGDDKLKFVTLSSGAVTIFGTCMHMFSNTDDNRFKPFVSPAIHVGSFTFFLCWAILSSFRFRSNKSDGQMLFWRNAIYLNFLLVGQFLGRAYDIDGLTFSSTVFLVIFVWIKSLDLVEYINHKEWTPLVQFCLFASLYIGCLYLHKNPEYIHNLFGVKENSTAGKWFGK